jgi:acyl-CoA thioesterase-1
VLAGLLAPAGFAVPPAAEAPVVLVVGDSLSAAYGMEAGRGWVALLQGRIAERGLPHQVVNASISGDTTRGGVSRLPAALERHRPALVVLELGGNDGLRGVPLAETEANLAALIERAQVAGAGVLLAGIQIPPNYGPAYTERFRRIYPSLAERYRVALVPFLLEGVAGEGALMQEDGIHPRAEAQGRILDNVWAELEPLLTGEGTPSAEDTRPPATGRPIVGGDSGGPEGSGAPRAGPDPSARRPGRAPEAPG